jgi:hypothetical protein
MHTRHVIWLDGLPEAFALLEQVLAGARRRGLTLHSLHCEQSGDLTCLQLQVNAPDAAAADRFTAWLATVPAVTRVGRADLQAAA